MMRLALQIVATCVVLAGHHVFGQEMFLYNDRVAGNAGASWSYHDQNGPEYWCKLDPPYPECCKTKKRQSPVNINIGTTKYPAEKLKYKNHDVAPKSMKLLNNGHTVLLSSQDGPTPEISFHYHLSNRNYKLDHVHFHWGKISSRGAEHLLDNKNFPMEMHFVYMRPEYKTLEDAIKGKDSIAVIGVFFEISKNDNHRLNKLIEGLKLVKYRSDDKMPIQKPFKYSDLFPSSLDYYFSYQGSLTSPPCSENVMWFVMNTKVQISESQLKKFRELKEKPKSQSSNSALVDNYRPPMDLHGRTIHKSKKH